jgi:E3 ubiquitin-protein ligase MYCBP2
MGDDPPSHHKNSQADRYFCEQFNSENEINTFVYYHSDKKEEKVFSSAQTFYVVDCGASGHNIRALPSLKALPVGKLKLGSSFLVTEQVFSMIPLL